VFSHDTAGGLLASNADAIRKNPNDTEALLFSKLFQLEDFKTEDGKFHLKIVYPGLNGSNEWKQKSNPVTSSTIVDYEPVSIDFTVHGHNNTWGGLGLETQQLNNCLITDTPTESRWFMCIGCKHYWFGGIPGPSELYFNGGVNKVELYIKRT